MDIYTNCATAGSDPALNFCKTPAELSKELNSFCRRLRHLLPFKQQGWHLAIVRGENSCQGWRQLLIHAQRAAKVHLPCTQLIFSPRGDPAFDRSKLLAF